MIFRRPSKAISERASTDRGFAIVMALSLLSLVFLLVISLVNLVGIDLSLGDARKERVLGQKLLGKKVEELVETEIEGTVTNWKIEGLARWVDSQ